MQGSCFYFISLKQEGFAQGHKLAKSFPIIKKRKGNLLSDSDEPHVVCCKAAITCPPSPLTGPPDSPVINCGGAVFRRVAHYLPQTNSSALCSEGRLIVGMTDDFS